MASTRLPVTMASRTATSYASRTCPFVRQSRRSFSSSTRCMVNPLLNLSHFSASKEAQFFSKERKIPREEFHPYLQLIRSSEVDPFAPAPGASPTVVSALKRAEMGRTDMQTTYNLAISNLIQQVEASRRETTETRNMLIRIHEKYRREERNSFLIMLSTVAFLTFITVKTNVLDDLMEYAQQIKEEWRGFDWEWLGNPPSYKTRPNRSEYPAPQLMPAQAATIVPDANDPRHVQVPADPTAHVDVRTVQLPTTGLSQWSWSRLFWAAPAGRDV